MRNLFTHPKRLPLIAPSILSADFANMGAECTHVLAPEKPAPEKYGATGGRTSLTSTGPGASADLLHVDIMDGHFVPNLTMGPDMVRCLRRAIPAAFMDVHLMVTDPWFHAQAFIAAGADHITLHVEVGSPENLRTWAKGIRELGVSVGLAVNPPTPIEPVLEVMNAFDLVLVMSVNPGRSGQAFIPSVLDKVCAVAADLTPNQRLQMDGGIKPDNVEACLDAGCDVVVAASAIFGVPREQRADVVSRLRG